MKWTFNRISQRDLRLLSGIVMLIYIAVHLANHALGLISLDVAEAGLRVAVTILHTVALTVGLYGAAATHFVLARRPLWSRVRFALFGAALLLPVLSALGFLEMGRELARESRVSGPSLIVEAEMPSHSAGADATLKAGLTMTRWRSGLLWG